MSGHYFEFSWYPINKPNDRQVVQCADEELMNLFLYQHGFTQDKHNVRVVQDDSEEIDEGCRVQIYTFGSKKRDQMYKIATTEEIMAVIVEEVGALLSSTMTFGACALLGDIEIFARILSLVEELDFVYVMEAQTDYSSMMTDFEKQIYTKSGYPYYEEIAMDSDDEFLYDQLQSESVPQKEYQAITVEAYVRLFTDIFIIGRKENNGNS